MYAVKAYNALGMTQTKAKLTVLDDELKQLEPHFVVALPRDVVVVAGDPALLAVQVAGQPPPDVLWFRVRLISTFKLYSAVYYLLRGILNVSYL